MKTPQNYKECVDEYIARPSTRHDAFNMWTLYQNISVLTNGKGRNASGPFKSAATNSWSLGRLSKIRPNPLTFPEED